MGKDQLSLLDYCREIAISISPGEIFLIGGLSRSGKTTLANNLRVAILERGLTAWTLSLDRWLRNVESREPGVMGRYDLSVIRNVIAFHASKDNGDQILQLPNYDKFKQCSIYNGDFIFIKSHHILIIEGTVAFALANKISPNNCLYVVIDELVRKQRVIEEYLSRGKSQSEAETIYANRQIDESPIIELLSSGVLQVRVSEFLCKRS